jgi:hypothetical protein
MGSLPHHTQGKVKVWQGSEARIGKGLEAAIAPGKLGRTGLGRVRWGQYTEGHFLESQDKALKRTTHARCRANGQTGQGRAGKRQTGQGNISKGGQAAQQGKKHIA